MRSAAILWKPAPRTVGEGRPLGAARPALAKLEGRGGRRVLFPWGAAGRRPICEFKWANVEQGADRLEFSDGGSIHSQPALEDIAIVGSGRAVFGQLRPRVVLDEPGVTEVWVGGVAELRAAMVNKLESAADGEVFVEVGVVRLANRPSENSSTPSTAGEPQGSLNDVI